MRLFTADVDSPCLFGLIHPAIYLDLDAAQDPKVMRHSVIHETTHYRHGDHIWSVLRCVCLAVHWYNPLVWWAAFLSQRDAEMACDESTVRRLGEQERAEYGRTLISMTCRKKSSIFMFSTTMTNSGDGHRERIMLIARKPKMAVYTLAAVLLIAAIAVGCTFTGSKRPAAAESLEETTVQPQAEAFSGQTEPAETLPLQDPASPVIESYSEPPLDAAEVIHEAFEETRIHCGNIFLILIGQDMLRSTTQMKPCF